MILLSVCGVKVVKGTTEFGVSTYVVAMTGDKSLATVSPAILYIPSRVRNFEPE